MLLRLANPHSRLRRLLVSWLLAFMVLGQLAVPGVALADAASVGNNVTKSWFDGTVPWDGHWGAFNQSTNEGIGGSCGLTAKQLENVGKLLEAMKGDGDLIDKAKDDDLEKLPGKPRTKEAAFQKVYSNRVRTGESLLENSKVDSITPTQNLTGSSGAPLPPSSQVKNYSDLYFYIQQNPATSGCDSFAPSLEELFAGPGGFIEMLKSPGQFMARLILSIAAAPFLPIYEGTQYWAIGMNLTTPHSERGDTLFDVVSGVYASKTKPDSRANVSNCGSGAQSMCDVQWVTSNDCDQRGTCGYNKERARDPNKGDSRPWISLAKSFRNLTSALYGIIVIAVCLIYLWRKSPGSAYDLKVILPRLFGAALLALMIPMLIGIFITTSNFLTQSIVAGGDGSVPAQINQAIWATAQNDGSGGNVTGFLESIVYSFLPVMLLIWFSWCYVVMIVCAIVRQFALFGVIVAAPFACVAMILERSQHIAAYWLRALVAVVTLPVVQAIILVLGLNLSLFFFNPAGDQATGFDARTIAGGLGIDRIMAAIVLAVTVKMMTKAFRQMRGYVTGNSANMGRVLLGKGAEAGALPAGLAVGALTGNVMAGKATHQALSTGGGMVKGNPNKQRKRRIPRAAGGLLSAAEGKEVNTDGGRVAGLVGQGAEKLWKGKFSTDEKVAAGIKQDLDSTKQRLGKLQFELDTGQFRNEAEKARKEAELAQLKRRKAAIGEALDPDDVFGSLVKAGAKDVMRDGKVGKRLGQVTTDLGAAAGGGNFNKAVANRMANDPRVGQWQHEQEAYEVKERLAQTRRMSGSSFLHDMQRDTRTDDGRREAARAALERDDKVSGAAKLSPAERQQLENYVNAPSGGGGGAGGGRGGRSPQPQAGGGVDAATFGAITAAAAEEAAEQVREDLNNG